MSGTTIRSFLSYFTLVMLHTSAKLQDLSRHLIANKIQQTTLENMLASCGKSIKLSCLQGRQTVRINDDNYTQAWYGYTTNVRLSVSLLVV